VKTISLRRCALATLVLLGVAVEGRAQSPPGAWRVTVAPYLMAAGMNGTAGIGRLQSDVDMSASDIFSNLQFGFMCYFEAMKGKWASGPTSSGWRSARAPTGRQPTST
jgi:hypothetical protein